MYDFFRTTSLPLTPYHTWPLSALLNVAIYLTFPSRVSNPLCKLGTPLVLSHYIYTTLNKTNRVPFIPPFTHLQSSHPLPKVLVYVEIPGRKTRTTTSTSSVGSSDVCLSLIEDPWTRSGLLLPRFRSSLSEKRSRHSWYLLYTLIEVVTTFQIKNF